MTAVSLTDELMKEIKLAKVFHDCNHHISSLEFDNTGEHCIVGCPGDESIVLYDALDGAYEMIHIFIIQTCL